MHKFLNCVKLNQSEVNTVVETMRKVRQVQFCKSEIEVNESEELKYLMYMGRVYDISVLDDHCSKNMVPKHYLDFRG